MSKFEVGDRVIYSGFHDSYLARIEFAGKPDVRGVKYLVSYKNHNDTIVYRKARDCDLRTVEIEEGDIIEIKNGKIEGEGRGRVEHIFNKKGRFEISKKCVIDFNYDDVDCGIYLLRHLKDLKLVEKGDKDEEGR